MTPNLSYKDVPSDYLHCQNNECPHSSTCMRFRIGMLIDETVKSFITVNPKYVNRSEDCPFYCSEQTIRYARGISRLYEDLPHAKYLRIKKSIHSYFGHTQYYRIYNELLLIGPKGQAYIHELFRKEGIDTPPVFDEYVEHYDFVPCVE